MIELKSIIQFTGLSLILIAHLAMRRVTEAKQGRIPFWRFPWALRDWFSPTGYWVQLVGWTFLIGALLQSAIRAFARG